MYKNERYTPSRALGRGVVFVILGFLGCLPLVFLFPYLGIPDGIALIVGWILIPCAMIASGPIFRRIEQKLQQTEGEPEQHYSENTALGRVLGGRRKTLMRMPPGLDTIPPKPPVPPETAE